MNVVVSTHSLWRAAERWRRTVHADEIEEEARHGLRCGGWSDGRCNVVTTPDGRRLVVVIEDDRATIVTVKEALG